MNSIGRIFRLTTFGESHGEAIGGIIDGCPANFELNLDLIQQELDRRKPGQSAIVTQRKEPDQVEFFSGIFEGKTTGMPIGFIIRNTNKKSKDYSHIKDVYRPSHADFVYDKKYGHRDYRGGGRSSARETANWVVAGAIAKQLLTSQIQINSFVKSVGKITIPENAQFDLNRESIDSNVVRCPHKETAEKMEERIREVRKMGDTIGGVIACEIEGVPIGWGEPIFDKLHARLAQAMMTINAAKGFEYGSGFAGTELLGSRHNDLFNADGSTKTNNSGGVQGGISNGNTINFKLAFKPVATLIQEQKALNSSGEIVDMQGKGRHDPCVLPRAVPVVDALSALVLVDFMLIANASKH